MRDNDLTILMLLDLLEWIAYVVLFCALFDLASIILGWING